MVNSQRPLLSPSRGSRISPYSIRIGAKGEYQQAIDNFKKVIASGDEWLKPYALLQMGMCWEKLGETKKAAEAYQKSLDLSPPPPWGTLASLRLKKLGGATQ